jgi:hypothetical protein
MLAPKKMKVGELYQEGTEAPGFGAKSGDFAVQERKIPVSWAEPGLDSTKSAKITPGPA